jgi:hypothetical protein
METLGDKLYNLITQQRALLFIQGETAQLTFQAYDKFVKWINEQESDTIEVTYPVGYKPNRTSIDSTHSYPKEQLIERYNHLAYFQLPINGVYQLVTLIENLFSNILKEILIKYPGKIPNKRKVDIEIVLEAKSLEEVKYSIINSYLNELSYKSPKDYAEEFNKLTNINLLEKPSFHKYIELKATRDIHIHNVGIANQIYISKADALSRVKIGDYLPIDIQYFLESYECCLQVTEILEENLNRTWPSNNYLNANHDQSLLEQQDEAIEMAIEKTIELHPLKK